MQSAYVKNADMWLHASWLAKLLYQP